MDDLLLLDSTLVVTLTGLISVAFLPVRFKSLTAFLTVLLNGIITSFIAAGALHGKELSFTMQGTFFFGDIPVILDGLSAWFILIINFTVVTGAWYGIYYMRFYEKELASQRSGRAAISLHWISYVLMHASLLLICIVQHFLLFLVLWEVMTLASFILIIFEHQKNETIRAGINFLIQSHIGVVFLTVPFLWVASRTGSYDFSSITGFTASAPAMAGTILFLLFFTGFAFKAGFVPFHTWLPYAHPAAPSHISAVMSGVIIKIGIYGILRMLYIIHTDYTVIGYCILIVSLISGIYGVMVAIVQHNLKKLLAYHSIENIGIIGIGIGLGAIGLGSGNIFLATLGFTGAMLHVLNHSLFKALLFYSAGNVYQMAHTMNVEQLGGLIKRMPHTAVLFLLSALAICGLPPFNGFISEFLIYTGLFKGLTGSGTATASLMLCSIFVLALIGGLAMLCFTKAFGIVFLGSPRNQSSRLISEATPGKIAPMYLCLLLMMAIGIFPGFFVEMLLSPLNIFVSKISQPATAGIFDNTINTINLVGFSAAGFIILCCLVFFVRKVAIAGKPKINAPTWGCGYTGDASRMQYTANSFIRSYRKLAKPLLSMHKKESEIKDIFPEGGFYETHPQDKLEENLIDRMLLLSAKVLDKFSFLQSGNTQHYILYGIFFILVVILFPFISGLWDSLVMLLQNM